MGHKGQSKLARNILFGALVLGGSYTVFKLVRSRMKSKNMEQDMEMVQLEETEMIEDVPEKLLRIEPEMMNRRYHKIFTEK